MSQNLNSAVAVIGIDIGKNSFQPHSVSRQTDCAPGGVKPQYSGSDQQRSFCSRRSDCRSY